MLRDIKEISIFLLFVPSKCCFVATENSKNCLLLLCSQRKPIEKRLDKNSVDLVSYIRLLKYSVEIYFIFITCQVAAQTKTEF